MNVVPLTRPGHRMLIRPDPICDADLNAMLRRGPETVWRHPDGTWRLCRYAPAHEAAVLLQNGWEIFDE